MDNTRLVLTIAQVYPARLANKTVLSGNEVYLNQHAGHICQSWKLSSYIDTSMLCCFYGETLIISV